MEINDITGDVLDAAVKLHKLFGPGLFESVYERLLKIELERRGHEVKRQVPVSFVYEGVCFEDAFRIDLLVDGEVVLELKSVASMNPVFAKQLKTYLVLTGKRVGLLINFGMGTLKDGFERVINSKMPDVNPAGKVPRLRLTDLDLTLDAPAAPDSLCVSPRIAPASQLASLGGYATPRDDTPLPATTPDRLCVSATPRDDTPLPATAPNSLCVSPRIAPASQLASLGGYATPREQSFTRKENQQ